jgi:hypothetical protein
MITVATITDSPETLTGDDGTEVRVCEVQVGAAQTRQTARILPIASGWYAAYRKGQRVLVAIPEGDPAAGILVLQGYGSPVSPKNGGNVEFHARDGKAIVLQSADGEVELELTGDKEFNVVVGTSVAVRATTSDITLEYGQGIAGTVPGVGGGPPTPSIPVGDSTKVKVSSSGVEVMAPEGDIKLGKGALLDPGVYQKVALQGQVDVLWDAIDYLVSILNGVVVPTPDGEFPLAWPTIIPIPSPDQAPAPVSGPVTTWMSGFMNSYGPDGGVFGRGPLNKKGTEPSTQARVATAEKDLGV